MTTSFQRRFASIAMELFNPKNGVSRPDTNGIGGQKEENVTLNLTL
jgi:hypothetical protein